MTIRILAVAIIGTFVLALAASCGGDGDDNRDTSAQGFFSEFEGYAQAFDDRFNELDSEAQSDFNSADSDEERVEIFTQFIENWRGAVDDFVSEMDGMEPAEGLEGLLAFAVEAGKEVLGMFDNVLAVLETVDTFSEATALLDGPGFIAATQDFANTCTALQAYADNDDISVDLRCP